MSAHEMEKSYARPLGISYSGIQPSGLQGQWCAGLPAVPGAIDEAKRLALAHGRAPTSPKTSIYESRQ